MKSFRHFYVFILIDDIRLERREDATLDQMDVVVKARWPVECDARIGKWLLNRKVKRCLPLAQRIYAGRVLNNVN